MKRSYKILVNLIILGIIILLLAGNNAQAAGTLLSTEKSSISFGTLSFGQAADYKSVTVFNNSGKEVNLAYETADSDNMLIIDAPSDALIPAGGYASFFVATNSDLEPGKHTASLYVYDINDISFDYYLRIDFTATVLLDAPYVTDIDIFPVTGDVTPGGAITFLSSVHTENGGSERVNWDVQGNYSTNTYIDNDGVLHVGEDETAPLLKITGTSQIDSSVYASALISVYSEDHTISAYPSNMHGGYVSPSEAVSTGEDAILQAYPYDGFTFTGWALDGRIVDNDCKINIQNVNASYMYEARFEQVSYNIDIKKNHPNAGAVSSSTDISKGTKLSLLAIPNDNFTFDGWFSSNELISDSTSLAISDVSGNQNYKAIFSPKYYDILGYSVPEGAGNIEGLGSYAYNHEAILAATANEGYIFDYWTLNGDIISTDTDIKISSNSDVCLIAHYKNIDSELEEYTITAGTTNMNGRIAYAGSVAVSSGSSRMYTIAPNSGYTISDVCVDGKSVGTASTYTFRDIDKDHIIIASFVPKPATSNPQAKAHTDSINKIVEAYDSLGVNSFPATNNINGLYVIDEDFIEENIPGYQFNTTVSASIYDMDEMRDFLGILGLSPVEARTMAKLTNKDRFFSEAEQNNYLNITIYNELGDHICKTVTNSSNSQLKSIAYSFLDDNNINSIVDGNPLSIGLYIFNVSDTISAEDKEAIKEYNLEGIKIDEESYFEMLITKNIQGYASTYRDLPHPVTIEIHIPDNLLQEDRDYYILNIMSDANGEPMLICITDEDDNPNTITFTTSTLSTYALAYADGPTKSSSLTYSRYTPIIIGLCFMAVVIISLYVIIAGSKKKA